MATELYSVNYITNHLENLPLADKYRPERISNLFCYHNFNDGNPGFNSQNGTNDREKANNNRSINEIDGTSSQNKTRKDEIMTETKTTSTQKFYESKHMEYEDNPFCSIESSFDKLAGNSGLDNQNPLSNKRKRSADSMESETINDEEVKGLVFNENKTRYTDPSQISTDHFSFITDGNDEISSYVGEKFYRHHFREKRPKSRPALNFDVMQRRCRSTSWLSVKLKPSEKKLKIIKFTPVHVCNRSGSDETLCLENLKREAYFKPITTDQDS